MPRIYGLVNPVGFSLADFHTSGDRRFADTVKRVEKEGRRPCPANAGIHFEGGIIPEISELALAAALPHNGIH